MKLNYSTKARRIALRHPLLSLIWTQIVFWIFSFTFFFILVNFISLAVTNLFPSQTTIHILTNILIAIFGAIIFQSTAIFIACRISHFTMKPALSIACVSCRYIFHAKMCLSDLAYKCRSRNPLISVFLNTPSLIFSNK